MKQAHTYTVELRIFGTMDPDEVSAETGLEPCDAGWAELDKEGRIVRRGTWAYNGGGKSGAYEWETLEKRLTFVLDQLSGKEDIFRSYSTHHLVTWWCGHFQSSIDGGPTLSPVLLRRLAEFGADLFIDNYFVRTIRDTS